MFDQLDFDIGPPNIALNLQGFQPVEAELEIQFPSSGGNAYPKYDGSYTVTPTVSQQTLPTEKTILDRDLVVESIPYSEVSNISGGMTATIG